MEDDGAGNNEQRQVLHVTPKKIPDFSPIVDMGWMFAGPASAE